MQFSSWGKPQLARERNQRWRGGGAGGSPEGCGLPVLLERVGVEGGPGSPRKYSSLPAPQRTAAAFVWGGSFLIKIENFLFFFFLSSSTLKATVGSFNHRVALSFLKEEERHFNFKFRGLKRSCHFGSSGACQQADMFSLWKV